MSEFKTSDLLKPFDHFEWQNLIIREVPETDENGEPTGVTLYSFYQSAHPMTVDDKPIPCLDVSYTATFTKEQLQAAGVWDAMVKIAQYMRNKLMEQEGV